MGSIRRISASTFTFLICLILFAACSGSSSREYVVIDTPYGNMKAVLYDSTSLHKENFLKLANESYYDDLLFHRVIQGFMIQGGDPDSRTAKPGQPLGMGDPGYTIEAEIGSPHIKGALAAARNGDAQNPQKRSSGSQFYIVQGQPVTEGYLNSIERSKGITYSPEQRKAYLEQGGTPQLDGDYTVFGRVIEGLDVIDKIAAVAKDRRDRPTKDIPMKIYVD